MINFRDHGDELSACGQVTATQLRDLAASGLRSLVCNRFDEEDGAVPSAEIARLAAELGVSFVHQPVEFSRIGAADGARFAELLDSMPKPMLAYCRTERRSAALWVMARAGRLGAEGALAASAASGCELSELRPRLTGATPERPQSHTARGRPTSQA